MIDPELRSSLGAINQHLVDIKAKRPAGIWRAFFNGMFSALGYVVGLAIIITLLAWILNITGVLPQFQKQVHGFQVFMNQAQQLMTASQNQQGRAGQ